MSTEPGPVSSEEKRQAMHRVLGSRTLARSEQLRAFLRYVCEAEIEGRGHEVNEYALGVFALGRPESYSPAEDSCVRSRAYDLRNRLRSYYESEFPEDPVRIEIGKGGYVPRFLRAGRREASSAGEFAVGSIPEATRALWAPFMDSEAPLLIVFEVRLFFLARPTGLVVRDYRVNAPGELAESAPLAAFQHGMAVEHFEPTLDYADFGSVHAAFLLGRLLSRSRRDVGIKHSASLDWQDLTNSNVVFIGKPVQNSLMRDFIDDKDFVPNELGVIANRRPRPGEATEYKSASTHGSGEKYALITRLPGPRPGRHLLILSGAGAELMWALAESVTNPGYVEEIMSHVETAPGEHPEAFQVVIRARFHSNVPVKIEYVTHHVLPAP